MLESKSSALPTWRIPYGAPTMIRTPDLLITNQLLYQLSYKGNLVDGVGLEPTMPLRRKIYSLLGLPIFLHILKLGLVIFVSGN